MPPIRANYQSNYKSSPGRATDGAGDPPSRTAPQFADVEEQLTLVGRIAKSLGLKARRLDRETASASAEQAAIGDLVDAYSERGRVIRALAETNDSAC